jgi:transposase
MKTPMPSIHETPEPLKALLTAERDAQKHQCLQALYLLQTQQAHTRRQLARLLGVHRETVGRWLATYATGRLVQRLTMAKAPGTVPLVSPAMQQALRDRLSQPHGVASDKAMGHWLRPASGVPLAYTTGYQFVRYTLRAKLKGPRTSPRKKP